MKIGFVGTQRGMTDAQRNVICELLRGLSGEFHHGDWLGADLQAHDLAMALGLEPVVHPPGDRDLRAFCLARRIRLPREYAKRSRDIVQETELLIAAPGENAERRRSATWSAVRYAKKVGRPILIVYPEGVFKKFRSLPNERRSGQKKALGKGPR